MNLKWPEKNNEAFKYVALEKLKSFENIEPYQESINTSSDLKFEPIKTQQDSRLFDARTTHLCRSELKEQTYSLKLTCPTDSVIHPKAELRVPENVHSTLIIKCDNQSQNSWINLRLDLVLEKGSSLTLISIVDSGESAHYCLECHCEIQDQAQLNWNHAVVQGAFSHVTSKAVLSEKAYAGYKSCILSHERTFHSFQPKVIHQSSHTKCDIQTRALAFDKSTVLQHGTIDVPEDSYKIEAHYSSDNLILGQGAKVFARPDLDIHCDDVICSHGVTFGSLDQEQIFYLQSRNLDYTTARYIILRAFVFKILNEFSVPRSLIEFFQSVSEKVESRLRELLAHESV